MDNESDDIKKAKKDGYKNGYGWYKRFNKFSDYVPGGPWSYDQKTRDQNKAWRVAWIEGVKAYAAKYNLIAPEYNSPI